MRPMRLASLARRGKYSTNRTPGTEVGLVANSPRISAGASGLGSNVSRWLGPPTWYKKMQEQAVALRVAPRASASNSLGNVNPAALRVPTFNRWRRWNDVRRKSLQQT